MLKPADVASAWATLTPPRLGHGRASDCQTSRCCKNTVQIRPISSEWPASIPSNLSYNFTFFPISAVMKNQNRDRRLRSIGTQKLCLSRDTFVAGLSNLSATLEACCCCCCCCWNFLVGDGTQSREGRRRFGAKRIGSIGSCAGGGGDGASSCCCVYAGIWKSSCDGDEDVGNAAGL